MRKDRNTCVSCYENHRDEHYAHVCQPYTTQIAFTRRVRKLLADPTPWHARPVAQADWSAAGMAKWTRAHMSDYPPAQSQESKAFRKALEATGPDWRRDAAPSSAGKACAECLYSAFATTSGWRAGWADRGNTPIRLLPIPHTCGLAVAIPAPARTTRARKAA